MKVVDQDIPSELETLYRGALTTSEWMPDDFTVKARHPFRIPTLQGCRTIRPPIPRGLQVSSPMCAHRQIFGACVNCFNKQPWSGGAEPDGIGPYSRTWWYTEAAEWWYFTYFMKQTLDAYVAGGGGVPNWCKVLLDVSTYVAEAYPDSPFGTLNKIVLNNQAGQRCYGLLKKPSTGFFTKLGIYLYVVNTIYPPYLWTVRAYEISPNWEENVVTWNTKPSKGRYLAYVMVDPNDTDSFLTFDVGSVDAVLLEVVGETPCSLGLRSDDWYVESERPFWG